MTFLAEFFQFLQRVCIARKADRCNRQSDSACPSVTFRCFVQTNEDTIVQFPASGRTIPLVSGELKLQIGLFAWDQPHR